MDVPGRVWPVIRRLGCSVMVVFLLTAGAEAKPPSGFGIGLLVGEPMGVTLKFLGPHGVQIHVFYDFSDEYPGVSADYVWHVPIASDPAMAFFFGGGVKLIPKVGAYRFGLRVPIGLNLTLDDLPFEFFAEVAPGLRLLPKTKFDIDGAMGARVYF